MILKSPLLESQIRRQVRQEIRKSPAARREARQSRQSKSRDGTTVARALIVPPLAALFVWETSATSIALAMGLLSYWGTAMAFQRISRFRSALHESPDLSVYLMLPASDAAIFWHQWRTVVRGSWFTVADFLLAYGIFAYHFGRSIGDRPMAPDLVGSRLPDGHGAKFGAA